MLISVGMLSKNSILNSLSKCNVAILMESSASLEYRKVLLKGRPDIFKGLLLFNSAY